MDKDNSGVMKISSDSQRPKSGTRKRKPESRKSDKKIYRAPKREFNNEKSVS